MDNDKLKKDLIEIYQILYPIINNLDNQAIFNDKLVKKFKYKPEEVSKVLLHQVSKEVKKEKKVLISEEISQITHLDELRSYYYNSLTKLFLEDEGKEFKNKISLQELKYLYSIISSIPIQSRKTKIDVYYMIKNYFDNESRTQDMMKNLK